jgi:2,4-diaminopentanoate dehydrogenase
MAPDPLRVVVWATGCVGSLAVRAVHRRPDPDLVGVWVHSEEKDGRDAGELVGQGEIGVRATRDADALLNLAPDCVLYTAPTRS